MTLQVKIFAVIAIYCAIFAWLMMPFMTTNEDVLRKQIMFVDSLQEHIVADSSAVVAAN